MTVESIVKKSLGLENIVINFSEFTKTDRGEDKHTIHARPYNDLQCRNPYCATGKSFPSMNLPNKNESLEGS